MESNIFSQDFNTKFGAVPFSQIDNSFYREAILSGIEKAKKEIESICSNPDEPTFQNTVVAFERTGEDHERVLNVFYPLLSAAADDELMNLSLEIAPAISDFTSSNILNQRLWLRIKHVYENKDRFDLDREDEMLLKKNYDSFRRNGALLEGDEKEKLKEINAALTSLTTRFGQNVLKELQGLKVYFKKEDLDGLPARILDQLVDKALSEGHDGEGAVTFDQPTYTAILKYVKSRPVRENVWRIYNGRNLHGQFSNREIVVEIANARLEKAKLLGYGSYAELSLEHTMAKTKENVYSLLSQLKDAYAPKWNEEREELQKYASAKENEDVELKPWDYSYYFNLQKNEHMKYDEEELRPYFPLSNAINGLFMLAERLYGLNFEELHDIDVYENDVQVYKVTDADGSFLGLLYMDFFPRDNKRGGAWMTGFRDQKIENGTDIRPLVSIVTNLTKPTEDKPSLLSPSEVNTLLHEFGHSLHGLLARSKYSSLSGTNVYRDFVELPSQFNENFMGEKDFLKEIGRHYQTGEVIPDHLIDKIIDIRKEGVGYACMRQLQFGFLDMAWHSVSDKITADSLDFEKNAIEDVAPFSAEPETAVSAQFNHIFSGGYAAGYYSYKWSEVLDADAFARFKEEGIFNKYTALSFRKEILERGGTEEPDELYRRFRGRDPEIEALLVRDGIR